MEEDGVSLLPLACGGEEFIFSEENVELDPIMFGHHYNVLLFPVIGQVCRAQWKGGSLW